MKRSPDYDNMKSPARLPGGGGVPLNPGIHRTSPIGQVVGTKHPLFKDLDLSESAFVVAIAQGASVTDARRRANLPDDYVVSPVMKREIARLRLRVGQAELMKGPLILVELWEQYAHAKNAGDYSAASNILMKITAVGKEVPVLNPDGYINPDPEFDDFDDLPDPLAEVGEP